MPSRHPNTLTAQYLENSWICYLATIANYLEMKVLCGSMVDYPNDSLASCYWSLCQDKWFVLPEHATAATSFAAIRSISGPFFTFQQDNAPAHRARKTVSLSRGRTSSGCDTGHQTARILNPDQNHAIWSILQERMYRCQICTLTIWKNDWKWMAPLWSAYHWHSSWPVVTASACYIHEKLGYYGHPILTLSLLLAENKLLLSIVVQLYLLVILFTGWFLSNAKTNFPETLYYCLQYMGDVFIQLCFTR